MNEVDSGATGNFKESLSGFQRIFGQFTSCPFCPSHHCTRINLINVHCVHCTGLALFPIFSLYGMVQFRNLSYISQTPCYSKTIFVIIIALFANFGAKRQGVAKYKTKNVYNIRFLQLNFASISISIFFIFSKNGTKSDIKYIHLEQFQPVQPEKRD
jgi:hypothetical protein